MDLLANAFNWIGIQVNGGWDAPDDIDGPAANYFTPQDALPINSPEAIPKNCPPNFKIMVSHWMEFHCDRKEQKSPVLFEKLAGSKEDDSRLTEMGEQQRAVYRDRMTRWWENPAPLLRTESMDEVEIEEMGTLSLTVDAENGGSNLSKKLGQAEASEASIKDADIEAVTRRLNFSLDD